MPTESATIGASCVETTLSPSASARSRKRTAPHDRSPHVVILAGGDGVRLRPVTRVLAGDERPKQFVALVGTEPLLVQTERRAALVAPAERTWIVLTRGHEAWYRELVPADDASLVIQPENRGTATGVLFALLRIAARTTEAPVVILPSDHWVSSDTTFMLHVQAAVEVVEAHPDAVVLLGVPPTRAETEYGWIEPGSPVLGARDGLSRVARFVEKPAADLASTLFAIPTSLWNTSVVVGRVEELLVRFATARPGLVDAFLEIWSSLGAPSEEASVRRLYQDLPVADFSKDILSNPSGALSVLAVRGVGWEDLGHPRGILEARRLRASPAGGGPVRPERRKRARFEPSA